MQVAMDTVTVHVVYLHYEHHIFNVQDVTNICT